MVDLDGGYCLSFRTAFSMQYCSNFMVFDIIFDINT